MVVSFAEGVAAVNVALAAMNAVLCVLSLRHLRRWQRINKAMFAVCLLAWPLRTQRVLLRVYTQAAADKVSDMSDLG